MKDVVEGFSILLVLSHDIVWFTFSVRSFWYVTLAFSYVYNPFYSLNKCVTSDEYQKKHCICLIFSD